ncbi:MAG: cell division protein ZapA [Deltaproteobacteria bacterium]|nr:cell division protein ZapA [Deltaproteobacteria bacterium]
MNRPVRIEILGREYFVKSNEGEERVKEIGDYVNRKIKEIAEGSKTVSTLNVAILVALNIAEDYFKAMEDQQQFENNIARKTSQIVDMINMQMESFG